MLEPLSAALDAEELFADALAELSALDAEDALAELDAEELDFVAEDALAEADAEGLAEADAEGLAEADALEDALGLLLGAFGEDPHAARPSRPARLRDSTAIDFFTTDFSFRHASRHHHDAVYRCGW